MSVHESGKKIIVGDLAHDAVDASSNNPVKIGGIAYSLASIPTAVASGDRTQSWHDVYGRQVVVPASRQVVSYGYKELPASSATDVTVSVTTARSGYYTPDAAFYDGSDAGFSASARWLKYELYAGEAVGFNATNPLLTFYNGLGVSVTLKLYGVVAYTLNSPAFPNLVQLESVTVANAGSAYFIGYEAGGTPGAGVYAVPAMHGPWQALILEITPASDPSSGYFRFFAAKTS